MGSNLSAGLKTAFFLFLLTLVAILESSAQKTGTGEYRIVFYNVENLFDPRDEPGKNDEEFTPPGKNHWTTTRLNKKAMMVYRAIVSASGGHFPDIIGLAEIENLWVLEYLLKQTPFKEADYGIVHKESPDPRGIDVALLYRKKSVKPADYEFIPISGSDPARFVSRDILYFRAGMGGEKIGFFVNHWPSRSGGYLESVGKRNRTALLLRKKLDSLLLYNSGSKLLLMGDFNATPEEECFTKFLRAFVEPVSPKSGTLVNLSGPWLTKGWGTIRTKGQWEIFDQFICTPNLLNDKGLHISTAGAKICMEPFLLEEEKRYLGKKPFRTYLGPVYHGGVSDHLPISVTLIFPQNTIN